MLTTLTITARPEQIEQLREEFNLLPGELRKATVMGINQTARSARTRITRALAGRIALSQAELRRRNVFRHLANYQTQTAEINIRGGHMGAAKFPHTPARMNPRAQRRLPGSSYRFTRGGSSILVAGSFTAEMPGGGHVGIFRRKGKGRLPLSEVRTESVPEIFDQAPELAEGILEAEIGAKLEKNIAALAGVILARRGKSGPTPAAGGEGE